MSAQMIAMQRAEALLRASGMRYAILLEDGGVLGDLQIAPPKTRVSRPKVNNFVRDFDYINTLKRLQPGDPKSWAAPSRELAVQLQKSVSATASRLWGKDNFITTVNGTALEVLRVV